MAVVVAVVVVVGGGRSTQFTLPVCGLLKKSFGVVLWDVVWHGMAWHLASGLQWSWV